MSGTQRAGEAHDSDPSSGVIGADEYSSGGDGEFSIPAAKLSLPRQGFVVPRPRLRALFEPLRHGGVASLVAGPGYGKTAFLVDAVTAEGWDVVYYGLRSEDEEPSRFLRLVVEGLRRRLPGLPAADQTALERSPVSRPDLLRAVSGVLEEAGRLDVSLTLIFEDVHFVTRSPDVCAVLQSIVDELPFSWRLLFTSRRCLPVSFDEHLDRGRAAQIDLPLLRMTPGEVTQWSRAAWGIDLTQDEARTLWRSTHGWPVALVLMGQVLGTSSRRPVRQDVVQLLRKGKHLNRYLSRHVFESLEGGVADLLKAAAFLPRVVFPRDAALFRDGEWAEHELADMTRRGFLVTGTGFRTFTLHPLVRAFAVRELEASDPARARQERLRVAKHLEEAGDLRTSISLYLEAQDVEAALGPLETLACESLNVSVVYTSQEWLRMFPEDLLQKEPWLLVTKARILQSAGQLAAAEESYRQAVRLFKARGESRGTIRATLGRVFCLFHIGALARALSLTTELEKTVKSRRETAECRIVMSKLLAERCDWDACVEMMEIALALAGDDDRFVSRIDNARANVFFMQGNIRAALHWSRESYNASHETSGYPRIMVVNYLATLLYMHGEYDESIIKGNSAHRQCLVRKYGFFEGHTWLSLAGAYVGLGKRAEAIEAIKEASGISIRNGDLETYVWARDMLGDLYRRNLNAAKAKMEHEESVRICESNALGIYEQIRARGCLGMDLAALGQRYAAEDHLRESAKLARRYNLDGLLCQALLYLSWLETRGAQESVGSVTMREAMRLSEQQENLHFFLQEASVAIPIYALADRIGAGSFLRSRIVPRLEPRLQKYFNRLASGALYPTDVELGPPRLPRLNAAPRKNDLDAELLAKVKTLTAREMDILRLVSLGMPNKKIGEELFITEKTVKTHTHHIFGKLDVASRWQAALIFQDYLKGMGKGGPSPRGWSP